MGAVLRDLRGGGTAILNPDRVFPAASVIKIPIMWEFFRQVEQEGLNPETMHVLRAEEKVHTSPLDPGVLREMHDGLPLTLRDLVTLMIIISDDTATNIMLDTLGIDNINRSMRELGLADTVVRRKMMDYERARAGLENTTTAKECDMLLAALTAERSTVGPAYRHAMLELLAKQQINTAIPLFLPPGMRVAHKTGFILDFALEHDVGILYDGDIPVLAASFLTKELTDNRVAIGRAAKAAFEACARA